MSTKLTFQGPTYNDLNIKSNQQMAWIIQHKTTLYSLCSLYYYPTLRVVVCECKLERIRSPFSSWCLKAHSNPWVARLLGGIWSRSSIYWRSLGHSSLGHRSRGGSHNVTDENRALLEIGNVQAVDLCLRYHTCITHPWRNMHIHIHPWRNIIEISHIQPWRDMHIWTCVYVCSHCTEY